MKRKNRILAFAPVLLGVLIGGALAHPQFKSASPAPNSAAATPPQEIKIEFSETIVPAMSAIEVFGAGGAALPTGKAFADPAAPTALIVKLAQPLPAGAYEARWRCVGKDTHVIRGSYRFEVRP